MRARTRPRWGVSMVCVALVLNEGPVGGRDNKMNGARVAYRGWQIRSKEVVGE